MIRFEQVSKEYPRSGHALYDLDLEIRKAEFCFLTGHSGAGKSTMLRLIHMADRPTRGEVRVSGYAATRVRSKEIALLRRKIGYIFQDFRLLPNRTAAENVAFALEVTGTRRFVARSRVSKLLAQVGLASKAGSYPDELSGGEQQRVAIARALVHGPLVLLADEPTGNLDERAARGILELFQTINAAGTAIVMATHDLELARSAPNARILELDQGALVYDSAGSER
jgi:cell division transport system ATP-binding protein